MLFDFFIIIIIIFIGFNIKFFFKPYIRTRDKYILNLLWLFHLIIGLVFWWYVYYGPGGDGKMYYQIAKEISFSESIVNFMSFGPGTSGMHIFNTIPAKLLSTLGLSLIYCLIGYIGIVFFYVLFIRQIKLNTYLGSYKLFPLIFFLPNLHFWSAGISKDAIAFFCIALFIYSMQQPSKNIIKIIISLGMCYMIRPHISVFLVSAFGLAFILDGKLKVYQKIFFSLLFLVSFIVLFEKFMIFLNVESLDMETIQKYSRTTAENLSGGSGSGVDISNYSYPLKILTFLYRPFFFDINSVLGMVSSFENLLLLILSIKFIRLNPIKLFNKGSYMFKGIFLFFMMGALTFSLILGNLGIMLREKNMFTPALLFICLWGFSYISLKKTIT